MSRHPSTSHSGEEPTESAVISAKDMSLLIDCIQALWKNSNQNESHPQSKYLRHGRGLKVGQWKIDQFCCAMLGTTKSHSFPAVLELLTRCTAISSYLAKVHVDKNFFGGSQPYVLLYAVQLDLLFALMKKHSIPYPSGKPSVRWYDGFTQEDPVADDEFDDESESVRAGNVEVCSLHDVVHATDLKEYANKQEDPRQAQLEGHLGSLG